MVPDPAFPSVAEGLVRAQPRTVEIASLGFARQCLSATLEDTELSNV
jgi:hypothetical protein